MLRKCMVFKAIAAVMLMCAGAASAKALKQEVDVTPDGTAKVTLNYCPDENQVVVNVNASGLAPDTTYTVEVLAPDGLGGATQMALDEFTTKPDKSKGKDNGKGDPKKTKSFKSKGHINMHIPWTAGPLAPPDLATWVVTITGTVAPEPTE